jgi:hypothetical protein
MSMSALASPIWTRHAGKGEDSRSTWELKMEAEHHSRISQCTSRSRLAQNKIQKTDRSNVTILLLAMSLALISLP